MAASPSLRVLAVVLLAVSLRLAGATVSIEDACKQHTKHPELCVKELSSANPEMRAAALNGGLAGLAELALSLASQQGAETVAFAAMAEPKAKDVPSVQGWLAAAKNDGDTCMGNCNRIEGGGDLEIVDKIGDLTKMCSIALSLTDASVHNRTGTA
ncbi:hypothetical protein HU200_014058 [Digitaria exilis]|uniref:Pectinesterase inhibitor domain-containing protein n=1 Tax=Digitaria exilis TaxID=1010633 RepID=A0A835FCM6_9POAL|nr:hypothetical protein HU200_014058 [Digitaria exilis]